MKKEIEGITMLSDVSTKVFNSNVSIYNDIKIDDLKEHYAGAAHYLDAISKTPKDNIRDIRLLVAGLKKERVESLETVYTLAKREDIENYGKHFVSRNEYALSQVDFKPRFNYEPMSEISTPKQFQAFLLDHYDKSYRVNHQLKNHEILNDVRQHFIMRFTKNDSKIVEYFSYLSSIDVAGLTIYSHQYQFVMCLGIKTTISLYFVLQNNPDTFREIYCAVKDNLYSQTICGKIQNLCKITIKALYPERYRILSAGVTALTYINHAYPGTVMVINPVLNLLRYISYYYNPPVPRITNNVESPYQLENTSLKDYCEDGIDAAEKVGYYLAKLVQAPMKGFIAAGVDNTKDTAEHVLDAVSQALDKGEEIKLEYKKKNA